MDVKDYYKILGVDKSSSPDQIKSAYRKLAMKYHPDKTKGDKTAEEKFKEVNEAYEVLKDPEKKKKYDQFGENWKYYEQSGQQGDFDWSQFNTGGGGRNYSYSNRDFGSGDFSDFFENLFGGMRSGRSARSGQRSSMSFKGQDYNAELVISLEDAYKGNSKTFSFEGDSIKLNIKPGITDGQVLKLSGKGAPGVNGGPNGDLFITIKIEKDPVFERKGNDLYTNLDVDMFTALLGGKVNLKTFKGSVNVNIQAGTQSGKLLKLSKMGMPVYGKPNESGNLYATVMIKIPDNLSEKSRKKIEELRMEIG